MLTFGAQSPSPTPTGQVCLPVAGCLPLSGGISEGGYIVLLLLIAMIVVGVGVILLFWRYGSTILGYVKATQAEAAAAKKEAMAAKGEAAAARFGINNNHSTNVRDDIDGNHTEVIELVKLVAARVENIADDVGGIRSEMRDVRRIAGDDRRRVADLDARLTRHVEAAE